MPQGPNLNLFFIRDPALSDSELQKHLENVISVTQFLNGPSDFQPWSINWVLVWGNWVTQFTKSTKDEKFQWLSSRTQFFLFQVLRQFPQGTSWIHMMWIAQQHSCNKDHGPTLCPGPSVKGESMTLSLVKACLKDKSIQFSLLMAPI